MDAPTRPPLHRPRTARPAGVRAAWAVLVTTGVVVLAAACGALPSSVGTGAAPLTAGAGAGPLAFSHCMRAHGVLNWPDPASDGSFPKETAQQLGVGDGQYQAAQSACAHLLPNAGPPTQAQLQRAWTDMGRFAVCVRAHGVPDWPSPSPAPPHPARPIFDLHGIDPNAPTVRAAIERCSPLLQGSPPYMMGSGS